MHLCRGCMIGERGQCIIYHINLKMDAEIDCERRDER